MPKPPPLDIVDDRMTVRKLIELLQAHPNPDAHVYVWDPFEEIEGHIQRVQDIHHPTDNQEVYLITEFG